MRCSWAALTSAWSEWAEVGIPVTGPPVSDGGTVAPGVLAESTRVLAESDWTQLRDRHERRVQAWIAPRLARRSTGQVHPVDDFLFDYYAYRPAQLRRWHPGYGITLAGAADAYLALPAYRRTADGITVSPATLLARAELVTWVGDLLRRTAAREPHLGCLALHEWAMVYRCAPDEVRHPWPLRLSPAQIAEFVDSQALRCTHFDAFRFFTPAARPRNDRQPNRADQPDLEQPGCLHAVMDLYKWAYKLQPLTSSSITTDAFALARDARDLDMRVAPYDLRDLGYEPVRIETPAGRREFVARQRELATRGGELRAGLATEVAGLSRSLGELLDRTPRESLSGPGAN